MSGRMRAEGRVLRARARPRFVSRRAFIGAAALLGAGVARPAEAGVFFWGRLFSVPPRDTPFITPNDQFYRVNYSDHSLEVGGRCGSTSG